ncbi:MAG: CPCC family cysteine-rich protein [Planctomycetota bacterium]
MNEYSCYVCGYYTLESRCDWDVCPICFWEDDILADDGLYEHSPANHMTIAEAKKNYIALGAVSQEYVSKVRKPVARERRDPAWTPAM